jgi:hypothetical protein
VERLFAYQLPSFFWLGFLEYGGLGMGFACIAVVLYRYLGLIVLGWQETRHQDSEDR